MVAEEFDGGGDVFGGHAVEVTLGVEESVGGEDVEVGDFVADGGGDPVAGGADSALVASRAEVATLAVKAKRRSWPQSGHWSRVKPEARSPQRRKDWTVATAAG